MTNIVKTFNSNDTLIDAFLSGETEGRYGERTFTADGDFYNGKVLIAKRTKDGEVLLGNTTDVSEEINDSFLIKLVKAGIKFTRVGSFSSLLNPNERLNDFRSGNHTKLQLVSKVYGFDFKEEDSKVYVEKAAIEEKYHTDLAAVNVKVAAIEERITGFFNKLIEEQKAKRQAAELAAMGERTREATIKWDAGETLSLDETRLVKGVEGGTRLRTLTTANGRVDVGGTSGHRTSLNIIRQAYNKVAPKLFGTLTAGEEREMNDGYRGLYIGTTRDYTITISKGKVVNLGCQSVTKAELERFALSQGWPVDGTPVAA